MNTRARIATVCKGNRGLPTVESSREYSLSLLDLALRQRPDLVCLPETCTNPSVATPLERVAEKFDGPTITAVSKRAKEHRCYVICPLATVQEGRFYNSAVLVDRRGEVAGVYNKLQPVTSSHDYRVFESGMTPGASLPIFELDFGRMGIQICFDVGFQESWQKFAEAGVRLVVWCSAYNGGFPLRAYAALHNYYVVSAVHTSSSRVIDPCGDVLAGTDGITSVACQDINLDYVVCHYDFNYAIPDRILGAYGERVKVRPHVDEGMFLVEPVDTAVTTAQLQREFGFESRAEYFRRHREAYRDLAAGRETKAQAAGHGERAMYSK
jgi:beta-ureidopropionase